MHSGQRNEPKEPSSEWNFGPDFGTVRPVRWLVDHIASHWGVGARWIVQPGQHPHEAQLLTLDSSKARAQLGGSPRWDIDRTAGAVVEWYQAFDLGAQVKPVMVGQIAAFMNSSPD
jgi:CDP-glucose 4,6-dehydratase